MTQPTPTIPASPDIPHILIVQDEPLLADTLVYQLKKVGLQPVVASTGSERLGQAQRHWPRIVLLGIMLPEMSGIEVCRKLRTEPQYQPNDRWLVILLMRARSETSDKVGGLAAGADHHWVKPFAMRLSAPCSNIVVGSS